MLPRLGYHDSSIESLDQNEKSVVIHLSAVEEPAEQGESELISLIVTFEGIHDIRIDDAPAERILEEGVRSPDDSPGELYSLAEAHGEVRMLVFWNYREARRQVPKSYAFRCKSISVTRSNSPATEPNNRTTE